MDIKQLLKTNVEIARIDLIDGDFKLGYIAALEDQLDEIESTEVEDAEDLELEYKRQRYENGACSEGGCGE